jgi:hypothetical protein
VIIRMPTISPAPTTTGSPTVTPSGSFTLYIFNGSGSIIF